MTRDILPVNFKKVNSRRSGREFIITKDFLQQYNVKEKKKYNNIL